MVNKEILQDKSMQKIFGHVEIQTIIKKIEGKPLKQTERNYLSRSIRPKLRAAALVTQENILSEINAKKKDSAIIEYNLAQYSYPLIILKKTRAKKLAIEELIIEILTNYPFARFIEAIPFLFLKNEIEQWKLLELAAKAGVKNKIGYLLETAFLIKPIYSLQPLLTYLKKNKDKGMSQLVEGDYEFLLKTSPQRIKKWNLLGRFFDEDFKKLAKAYV